MVVKLKTVLVTGASGFIGRHVVNGLVRRGYQVHGISRNRIPSFSGFQSHQGDLFDDKKVLALLKQIKPSHLLHLAWNVKSKSYMTDLENFHWVKSSLRLMEVFQQNGGQRAVFAGTCAEYDWRYGCLSETMTPCMPSSNYGLCKHSLYEMVQAFCRTTGISMAWGRIFFMFGPHEAENRLAASTIISLLFGRPAICTHGEQYRDFLYVKDVADAFCALIDSPVCGAVNIGSGKPMKIRELVATIAEIIGKPELIQMGGIPQREGDPSILCANIERLSQEVLWSPKHSIREGIEQTVNWWERHL